MLKKNWVDIYLRFWPSYQKIYIWWMKKIWGRRRWSSKSIGSTLFNPASRRMLASFRGCSLSGPINSSSAEIRNILKWRIYPIWRKTKNLSIQPLVSRIPFTALVTQPKTDFWPPLKNTWASTLSWQESWQLFPTFYNFRVRLPSTKCLSFWISPIQLSQMVSFMFLFWWYATFSGP